MLADWTEQLYSRSLEGLVSWFSQPLDPSKRLFWVFLLSAAILAVCVTAMERRNQARPFSWHTVSRLFFNRRYWFNASTATDLKYSLLNAVLKPVIVIPLVGSHLWLTLWWSRTLLAQFGAPVVPDIPWFAIATLYAMTFFLVEDLSRFLLHRAMHRYAWLWRFHRVHHSATVLTPITLLRSHPVEMFLYTLRGTLVFGTVSGLFLYWFAQDLTAWDILGVDALGFLFAALGANLRHSHVWLSFGAMERWLISPAQHQLHHSSALAHQNKNYGSYLACWDRLSNSLLPAGKKQPLRFGLAVR